MSFKSFALRFIFLLGYVIYVDLPVSHADTPTTSSWFNQTTHNIRETLKETYTKGQLAVYLSGYAYHGRHTYSEKKLAILNETAWGMGISKVLRDTKDNEQSLYFLVFADSHRDPQYNLGYNYLWMRDLPFGLEAGVGLTASLISRRDMFSHIPFPVILPVASIGTRHTKLVASYVPRVSENKGNGDVFMLTLRIDIP